MFTNADDLFSVRAEGHAMDTAFVPLENLGILTALGAPYLDFSRSIINTSGVADYVLTIRTESDSTNRFSVPPEVRIAWPLPVSQTFTTMSSLRLRSVFYRR